MLDNVALAVQAVRGQLRRLAAGARDAASSSARAALDDVGLGAKASTRSTQLSHGEQRALEVGMALASRPRLLLLDEPMAGMGAEESARMER